MKKTDKTALTAAIFAAAMSAAAVTGGQAEAETVTAESMIIESLATYAPVYGPSPDIRTLPDEMYYEEGEETSPQMTVPPTVYGPPWIFGIGTEPADEFGDEFQDVYGPPPIMETTDTPTEPVIDTTLPEFQEVYGPPPETETTTAIQDLTEYATVYGPMWYRNYGDVNGDGSVDVFDMPLMRKAVTGDYKPADPGNNADVNRDGQINVADLVALSQYLTGQRDLIINLPKDNKIKVIYNDENTDPTEPLPQPEYGPPDPYYEDPTEPFTDIPQPKYGPQYAGDPEKPTDHVEEPTYQVVYGPPSVFGLEDF
ncbi:MAG: dockerin type I repeat-containing protein [Ruminococcus sp.]|nr:dockerin type I repeat-containing protein [Ruminococcus sp.]